MKATLLALLTLGSLAMAADITTTVAPQWKTGLSVGAGSYTGISFILTPEAVRYSSLSDAVLPAVGTAVTLTNIEIANGTGGSDPLPKNLLPVITDSEGYLVALAVENGSTVTRAKNTYYGNHWDYTRDFTTWSSYYDSNFSSTITLKVGDQYNIYFMNGDQSYDLMEAIMTSQGQPVKVTEEYYQAKLRLATTGSYDSDTSSQYGFIGGTGAAPFAPLMGVTVAYSNVPEPTTGTLSLLALAGLCIRRRK